MNNALFQTVPLPKVPRNVFDLSRKNKLSLGSQRLYPTAIIETLPGDRHLLSAETFVRAQPMLCPVYQDYNISHHAFFVPMRTLSKNWEQFITGGKDGTYTSVMPYVTYAALYRFVQDCFACVGDLEWSISEVVAMIRMFDYIGLSFRYESKTTDNLIVGAWLSNNSAYASCNVPVNLLPFLACVKVWSEYYRDENLVDDPLEVIETALGLSTAVGLQVVPTYSIDDSEWDDEVAALAFIELFKMRPRAWKKDRFTSALPFSQRGPDVLLPIAGVAPVTPSLKPNSAYGNIIAYEDALSKPQVGVDDGDTVTKLSKIGDVDFADAELSTTINDFRRAERLQRWYENSARGGSRLNENTLAHWGVHTPDATLQRAQFLGGQYQPLTISDVPQTSESGTTPQGTLAGKGTSYASNRLFKHYDSEHGYIIVFTSILMHADYYQGTPRIFTRQDRFEYAWPEFANLGEEPIENQELYTLASDPIGPFGYTPRYSDYKSAVNETHGDFRGSLRSWALPRTFANQPQLNEEFIYGSPSKENFAVTSDSSDEFLMYINFHLKSSRLLPFYGVPTL